MRGSCAGLVEQDRVGVRRDTIRCRWSSGSSSGPRNSTMRSSSCRRSPRRQPSSSRNSPPSDCRPAVRMMAATSPVRPFARLRLTGRAHSPRTRLPPAPASPRSRRADRSARAKPCRWTIHSQASRRIPICSPRALLVHQQFFVVWAKATPLAISAVTSQPGPIAQRIADSRRNPGLPRTPDKNPTVCRLKTTFSWVSRPVETVRCAVTLV